MQNIENNLTSNNKNTIE